MKVIVAGSNYSPGCDFGPPHPEEQRLYDEALERSRTRSFDEAAAARAVASGTSIRFAPGHRRKRLALRLEQPKRRSWWWRS